MHQRFGWMTLLLGLIAIAAAGVLSYNAGVAHGIAISPALANAPAAGIRYGWYRPWGFGFFPPLFFLLFWFLVFGIFSRGWHGRRRWYGGRGWVDPRTFDEWHRHAHEEMNRPS